VSEIVDFTSWPEEQWHFPYHEANRVIIEGREIPRLRARDEGGDVALIVDGRFSVNVPKAYGRRVAWLLANALAIGAGYSDFSAPNKGMAFAHKSHSMAEAP
jgi:hypothetical protein